MPSRRKRGTRPALRMAVRQSRIRLACAQMALISLIFVTPMATRSSGLLGKLPDLIGQQKTEEGRPFGKVLPLWWTPATTGVPRVHQRFRNRFAALQHLGVRQFNTAKRRRYACRLNRSATLTHQLAPNHRTRWRVPQLVSRLSSSKRIRFTGFYWEEYGAAKL